MKKTTTFEKLIRKSEIYLMKSLKANSDKMRFYWARKSESAKIAAYNLTLSEVF